MITPFTASESLQVNH